MTNGQETLSRVRSESANYHFASGIAELSKTSIALFIAIGDLVFAAVGCMIGLVPLQRSDSLAAAVIAAVVAVVLLQLVGLYRWRLTLSVLDDLPYLALASIGAALGTAYLLDRQLDGLGMKGLAFLATGAFVVTAAWRALGYASVRQFGPVTPAADLRDPAAADELSNTP